MKMKIGLALRENLLLIMTLIGVVLGVGLGFAIRQADPSANSLMWLGLPGKLYLRLLKMMIVPLIVSSVTTGTASLDPKANGKISMVSFVFIFLTNMVGAILGILSYVAFKPGVGSSMSGITIESSKPAVVDTQDVFADLLRNIIPDNLFEATFRQTITEYEYGTRIIQNANTTNNVTIKNVIKYLGKTDGPNLLGLIFACTLIGIAAASLKEKGKTIIDLLESISQTVIVIIRWFLWTTPIGVLSLILVAIADIPDISVLLRDLGMFIAAVTVAITTQQLIVLPLILFVTTRRNPYRFLFNISRPWLISFASASTAVAIPEMFRACEASLRIDKRIVRFVIPFSVTLSANGSAVFIACSSLFIASISGVVPTVATILVIGCLTTVSSLAIPSVPSASIVTIVMILTSLNIPTEAVALLFTTEFFLDRIRSTSSVVSHTMCAAVTHHMCANKLPTERDHSEGDVELEIVVEQSEDLLKENGHITKQNEVLLKENGHISNIRM